MNCTPFVRQYGILSNKWGVFLCQRDIESPLTTIRAYTEALLEGVAPDEAARQRYLQTIYARETDLEALVKRLFELATGRQRVPCPPRTAAPVPDSGRHFGRLRPRGTDAGQHGSRGKAP